MTHIIIGVGNILFKDEGIGVFASKYLKANYSFSPNIEIMDGGTLGFNLMRYFEEYDNVIILDIVSAKDAPGSIYRFPSDILLGLGDYKKTAHEVEIVEMLEICSLLDHHADVTIIGIIPEDIKSTQVGLTSALEKKFKEYIGYIIKELEGLNIKAIKTGNRSLNDIAKDMIGSYNLERLERIPR